MTFGRREMECCGCGGRAFELTAYVLDGTAGGFGGESFSGHLVATCAGCRGSTRIEATVEARLRASGTASEAGA